MLQFINHPEGYVEPLYTLPKPGSGQSPTLVGTQYVYQYKDHLGNIRLSYADNDNDGKIDVVRNNGDVDGDGDNAMEIREEKNYYPFGLQHKGYNNTITGREHNYGFGNKEENDELGLEWLDFGARNYDASLGRWMNLDPMAEMFYGWTPYKYSMNNPILLSDPDGNCEFCKKFLKSAANTYKQTISNTYEGAKKLVTSPIQTVKAAASNHFTAGGMMRAADTALNVVTGGMHEVAKNTAKVATSDDPVATAGEVYGETTANLTVEAAGIVAGEVGGKLIGPLTKSASKVTGPVILTNISNKSHSIASSIAKKFNKNGSCVPCANNIVKALKEEGITGKLMQIKSNNVQSNMGSKIFSKKQNDVISTNGYHYGVEVEGKVFDNIHTGGINYADWKADFEVLVGASIKQVDKTH